MCGIVGYVGNRPARDIVIDGLRRLEYRGYDSAGVAVLTQDIDGNYSLDIQRRAGRLKNLEEALVGLVHTGTVALGHTRWATHGSPSDNNAHPHRDCTGQLAVVHNGIIENYAALKQQLQDAGHAFTSDTDTEVVVHLLEEQCSQNWNGDLAEAMRRVCTQLEGAFTLLAVHRSTPDVVVGARRNSPLVIGLGTDEVFLASDVAAFIAHTRTALEIGQDQVVELRRTGGANSVTVTDYDGNVVQPSTFTVDWDAEAAEKSGFPSYMLKEIHEQPRAIADTLRGRLGVEGVVLPELDVLDLSATRPSRVIVVACGTAFHAGLVARHAVEEWAGLACTAELASEFRYRKPVVGPDTLVVAVSQSGETMDTLMALRTAKAAGARTLALVNAQGSTIAREADAVLYTRCGPEIGVAATKTFLGQVTSGLLLALYLAQPAAPEVAARLVEELRSLPRLLEESLGEIPAVTELATTLLPFAQQHGVLFLGRGTAFPVALEAALKLKEISYLHAEGFAAGELKHGPIALVERGTPVIALLPAATDPLHPKMISNIEEVRARGAKTVVVAAAGDSEADRVADYRILVTDHGTVQRAVTDIVPLQVLACAIAEAMGLDVDKPRNLAKSVTVE